MPAARKRGPAAEAAERELRPLPKDLRDGLLAATVRELARQLDDPDHSLTAKSAAAGQVLALLTRLRELAPPQEEADAVNDIETQRAKRLAGAKGMSGAKA